MHKITVIWSAMLLLCLSAVVLSRPATAQKVGGGTQSSSFAGNWKGTITASFGTGAFTMRISQSATGLSGSVHFGAPIFDATLKLTGNVRSANQFTGTVSNGEGGLPIAGSLSADGKTITGTVIQGQTFSFTAVRQ